MRTSLLLSIAAAAASALAAPGGAAAAPGGDVMLRPTALRLGPPPDFPLLGRGGEAGARWSRDAALDGSFSIRADISPTPVPNAIAGAEVMGVVGRQVAELDTLGLSATGDCDSLSPRFVVLFDSSGDGSQDGSAIFGCDRHRIGSPASSWTSMRADALAPDVVVVANPTAPPYGPESVVSRMLAVTHANGFQHLDRIEVAGATTGEPGSR